MQTQHPAALARAVVRDLRRTWLQLAVTDLLARFAGFALLIPIPALLLHLFLFRRESAVLTDEEILFFFLSPLGALLLVCGGAVWGGLLYAKQAGLMTIAFGALRNQHVSYVDALTYAAHRAWPLVRLAARMTVRFALIAAPFLAAIGFVYSRFLTAHDINYYLAVRPPEFWQACGWTSVIALPLVVLVARQIVNWLFAVPILLFQGAAPRDALESSTELSRGRRWTLVAWLVAWAACTSLVSASVTGSIGFVARQLIPADSLSLPLVAAGVGLALGLNAAANLVVTLVAGTLFSLLVVRLYAQWAPVGDLHDAGIAPAGSLGERGALQLPRQRIVWITAFAALSVVLGAYWVVRSHSFRDDAEIAAHRGASAAAPENTLAAFERAIVDDADWVELDVQESADGVIVVAHDKDFMKVAGVAGKVWELTAAELAEIDIGSWFGDEFNEERVPTLAQALELCRGRINVLIELKYYGHEERLEERVIEAVEAAGMESNVKLMSLDYDGIRVAKGLRPSWSCGLLVAVAMGNLSRLDVDFVAVNAKLARRHLIRAAHRRGKEVFVWTVNDASQMSAMLSRGVDTLITDEPGTARSVIQDRAEMSPVERLIVDIGVYFGIVESDESSAVEDA